MSKNDSLANPIERIVDWNIKRNNVDFNLNKELKFVFEELFEAISAVNDNIDKGNIELLSKALSSSYVSKDIKPNNAQLGEIVDAFGDAIVFLAGAIFKMGFNPITVLNTICDANNAKGNEKDNDGKIIKDKETFEHPKFVPFQEEKESIAMRNLRTEELKISDGYVFKILTESEVRELFKLYQFTLYYLNDDNSETLIEEPEPLSNILERAELGEVGIEVGRLFPSEEDD